MNQRDTWPIHARQNWSAATGLNEWPADQDYQLCDLIADGLSFGQAARAIGRSTASCKSRFQRIARKFGKQGR